MALEVFCRTRFIGYHQWKDAPPSCSFLANLHRHEFHVEVCVLVDHSDRDVEFISLRDTVDDYLRMAYHRRVFGSSCELIASTLALYLEKLRYRIKYVEVSEDGENGGRYVADPA